MSTSYPRLSRPDSLLVFSYVWAAQTLCQLAVFRSWLREGHITAWVLLLIAALVLLFPGRPRLFVAMLLASVVHYVSVWPFVSNHVLVDTILPDYPAYYASLIAAWVLGCPPAAAASNVVKRPGRS